MVILVPGVPIVLLFSFNVSSFFANSKSPICYRKSNGSMVHYFVPGVPKVPGVPSVSSVHKLIFGVRNSAFFFANLKSPICYRKSNGSGVTVFYGSMVILLISCFVSSINIQRSIFDIFLSSLIAYRQSQIADQISSF